MSELSPFTRAIFGLPAALGDIALPLPGADAALALRDDLRCQLRDYILPRLTSFDAPVLAVVGGSTGAGKSTLVNSLVGRVVSRPGVLRPTTRSPVLIYHPANEMWFNSDRILPALARSTTSAPGSLLLVQEPSLPPGLALLDAPDIDSIEDANRALAAALLAAADLWLFVTSAARYADAVPWGFLTSAAERGAAVAVVCDRIPRSALTDVPRHLGQLMSERGLGDSPLFTVPETTLGEDGLLPDAAVSPVRSWLAELVRESVSRQAVVRTTLTGAVGSAVDKLERIAAAADEQVAALDQLSADAGASFREAARRIATHTSDGTLLRGEVLSRWQDFVGTGEFMRAVERRVSWVKDRVLGAVRGPAAEVTELQTAVTAGLIAYINEEAEAACERTASSWRGQEGGRYVLAQRPDLAEASDALRENVARAVREWQGDIGALVAEQGASKRVRARLLAVGVNGLGAALIIFLFASTGGLTGAEVGVAGGASLLAQRMLEAVFGDGAVRTLAAQAKRDLDARVEGVLAIELARYQAALPEVEDGTELRRLSSTLNETVADEFSS